ncbi:MAG: phosphatase PAP2 family protein [Caldilineaceae bacterium]
MKNPTKLLALLLTTALLLGGCVMPAATSNPVEAGAGKWQTWVLTTPDEVRPPAPPDQAKTQAELQEMHKLIAGRDATALQQIAYWDAGAPNYRWLEIIFPQFDLAKMGPSPRYARGLALLNIAIYDATVATWSAKYTYNRPRPSQVDPTLATLAATPNSPSYPSEHAAAAGAAAAILAYLFPDHAATFAAQAEEAGRTRVMAGVQYPSDVAAGLDLGRTVAAKVIERAKTDGSDAKWDGKMPTEPGHWTGTNPVEPTSGSWKTWVLASGSQLRPAAPPAYDSAQEKAELNALETFTRTFATNYAAFFWQALNGGGIPYWYTVAGREIFEHHLDLNPPQAARIYAAISVAQYDAYVACYDAKYTYWAMRPFQVDPNIKTLFTTPNHPSYPSAHGCQSGAMTTVLADFFPADREVLLKGAKEAGDSRLWAGIHFQSDVDAGLALGNAVGQLVIKRIHQ